MGSRFYGNIKNLTGMAAIALLSSSTALASPFDFHWPSVLQRSCDSQMLPASSKGYRVATAPVVPMISAAEEFLIQQEQLIDGQKVEFLFHGRLELDGRLTLDFELVDHAKQIRSSIRGLEAFAEMMEHLGSDRMVYVQSDWSSASNNHASFINNVIGGASPQQAALSTWTARQLQNYGFDSVEKIWFEPKSTEKIREILDGVREASLDDFTVNVIFTRSSQRETQLNGPLAELWSSDGSRVWLVDLVFGYRLGLGFAENHIEILDASQVTGQHGSNQSLLDLQKIIDQINAYLSSPGRPASLSVGVSRDLYKALSTLRPFGPQTKLGDFQLSLLGKILAKYNMLADSVSSSGRDYEVIFR
ncbi:MAG: hypothetical protein HRT45_05360 [Bdellovibrionales bacterium]|nr:hypothetical protein [Bdellovibrionales bacterium]